MRTIFFGKSLILLSILYLSSCYFKGGGDGLDPGLIIAASEREDQSDKRAGRGRSANAVGKCSEDRSCEDMCEDVYNGDNNDENEGKVETCVKVRYKLAIQFEKILEILTEPYASSLRNIEEDAFFEFLDVSLAPWVEITKDASKSEAEALLIWIVRELEIATAIVNANKNYEKEFDLYEGAKNLFKEIGSGLDANGKVNNCDRILGSSKNYKDIAEDQGNCQAMVIYQAVCSDPNNTLTGC